VGQEHETGDECETGGDAGEEPDETFDGAARGGVDGGVEAVEEIRRRGGGGELAEDGGGALERGEFGSAGGAGSEV